MATARHIGKVVLVPTHAPASTLRVRNDGTYLVTGGLGGLGFATAEWLAKRGAAEIVLVGRQVPNASDERLDRLRAAGCNVTAVACDIGDRDAVRALFTDVLASRKALRGIVHTAGVLADASLAEQNAERFDAVARGKIDGARHLSELSARSPLDFFVLYSSTSALLGSPGQASYAAANAFLDALAAHRRARGQVATSIGWGAWDEVGMAARLPEAYKKRWAQLGVGLLGAKDAFAALEEALLRPDSYVAIASLDPSRVLAEASPAVRALLGGAPARTTKTEAVATNEGDSLAALRTTADAQERITLLHRYVHREAARVLGFASSALDAETPLATFGFDSLMAVQLKNRVESDLAIEIPLVRFLASPTVVGLILEIAERLGSGTAPAASATADTWEEGSL
jgi:NAD(P)-dependent dehydrogenase (short-subunit alcohol dehydrogenase family)/acyl carrier protein